MKICFGLPIIIFRTHHENFRNPSEPVRNPSEPVRNPSEPVKPVRNPSEPVRNPSGFGEDFPKPCTGGPPDGFYGWYFDSCIGIVYQSSRLPLRAEISLKLQSLLGTPRGRTLSTGDKFGNTQQLLLSTLLWVEEARRAQRDWSCRGWCHAWDDVMHRMISCVGWCHVWDNVGDGPTHIAPKGATLPCRCNLV